MLYIDDPSITVWIDEPLGASAEWAENPVCVTTVPGSVAFLWWPPDAEM